MNDYEAGLLGGTPPDLTPEQLARIAAEQSAIEQTLGLFNQPEVPTQSGMPQPVATVSGQQASPQQPQQQQIGAFDPSKDYSYYEARGMSRKEWNRLQLSGGVGAEMEAFSSDPRAAFEGALAAPTGVLDAAIDALNLIPNIDIPKVPKFESDITQSVREISSIVIPTIALAGAGTGAIS